jgi:metal-responsive CopG/Arc/MetJ family transcriptional regulator
MAKVMISLPDELLASVDAEAERRGTTRSGLIRQFTDEALRRRSAERAATIDALFANVRPRGGDAVAQLKRLRP